MRSILFTQICRVIILTFSLVSFSISFIATADAATPRVTWKFSKVTIEKFKDGTEVLRVFIAYTNNSTDEKTITQLYDNDLQLEGSIIHTYSQGYQSTDYKETKKVSIPFKTRKQFSRVKKTEIWPGKLDVMTFDFPLKEIIKMPKKVPSSKFTAGKINAKLNFKYKTGSI